MRKSNPYFKSLFDDMKQEVEVIRSKRAEAMNEQSTTFSSEATEYFRGYEDALEYVLKYVEGKWESIKSMKGEENESYND